MRMSRPPADALSLLEGTLRAVVDEVECRPARPHPRFTLLVGQNVHRRVERRLLGPGDLALLEHALAHDVGADALRGVAKHVVDRAGLLRRAQA